MRQCTCVRVWCAKENEPAASYEDACSYARRRGRFAVSDGATQSIYAGLWARLLVRAARQRRVEDGVSLAGILEPARLGWQAYVDARRPSLPWYAEVKADQGGHATLLALNLHTDRKRVDCGTWHALAIGDSCLFQLREGQTVAAFPIADPTLFGSHPRLVPTRLSAFHAACSQAETRDGAWQRGDVFLLMTDAIACWFLEQCRLRTTAPAALLSVLRPAPALPSFRQLIALEREARRMRDDDVTVLAVFTGEASDELS